MAASSTSGITMRSVWHAGTDVLSGRRRRGPSMRSEGRHGGLLGAQPAAFARRLTAPSVMPSRAAASRWLRPSASRSKTSQPSSLRRSRSSTSRRTSDSASVAASSPVMASRVGARLARSTASRACTNAAPLTGPHAGGQRRLDRADPDADAPRADAREVQRDRQRRLGIGRGELQLVAGRAVGGALEARARRSERRLDAVGHEVVVVAAVALIRGDDEHPRPLSMKAKAMSV